MSSDEFSKPTGRVFLKSDDRDVMHFMRRLHEVLDCTTEVLCHHLDRSFDGDAQYVPATLIFNPLVPDHAFWINLGNGYGKTMTKDALEELKRFERWLLKREFLDIPFDKQTKITTRLPILSGPLFYFVADAIQSVETNRLLSAIGLVIEHLEQCVSAEVGVGGDYRAFRTAMALRAIFETYSDLTARSGDKDGNPTGPFCKSLEEIFKIGGIKGGFRHFAAKAQKRPPCDPLLVYLKQELQDGPARVAAQKTSSFTAQ